jgi:hypothetical protein
MYKLLLRFDRFLNPRRLAYAWITGTALWFAWLLSILLGPGNMDLANQVIGTDYLQFHAAGVTVRHGDSDILYDFPYQAELERQIAGPELVSFHAFITPPFFAYVFVPFSYLPYPISFAIWSILSLLCLYLSFLLLKTPRPAKSFLWSLTFFPVFAAISFGQNSLLSLFLMCVIYLLWRKRALLLAGLICSLLLFKPQLVLGIGLLWLLEWRKDWRALLGLANGGIGLVIISFAFMPQASMAYLDFARGSLSSMLTWEQFPIWHAHTWRAFWFLLLPNQLSLSEIIYLLFSLLGTVFFVTLWKKYRGNATLAFSSAIWLTLWVSPHAMIYDWTLILIPAVLLWDNHIVSQQLYKPLAALLWIALFISGPLTALQLKILPVALQISLPVFGVVTAIAFKTVKNAHANVIETSTT